MAATASDAAESDTVERLKNAEASMVSMLDQVNKETANVERAVRDLEAAQQDLDKRSGGDFVSNLRKRIA